MPTCWYERKIYISIWNGRSITCCQNVGYLQEMILISGKHCVANSICLCAQVKRADLVYKPVSLYHSLCLNTQQHNFIFGDGEQTSAAWMNNITLAAKHHPSGGKWDFEAVGLSYELGWVELVGQYRQRNCKGETDSEHQTSENVFAFSCLKVRDDSQSLILLQDNNLFRRGRSPVQVPLWRLLRLRPVWERGLQRAASGLGDCQMLSHAKTNNLRLSESIQ